MRTRKLTTKIGVAVTTTAMLVGGAYAATTPNLTYDLGGVALALQLGSHSVDDTNTQLNDGGANIAEVLDVEVGYPPSGTNDMLGGTMNVLVDANTIEAIAVGNVNTASIDSVTATGSGAASAATAASFQINGGREISATVDNSEGPGADPTIRIDVEDVGSGSTFSLSDNTISTDATGNDATTIVAGDVSGAFSSTEDGINIFDNSGAPEVSASAGYLSSTVQINDTLFDSGALTDDSRIGFQSSAGTLDDVSVNADDNLIEASFTGNTSSTTVAITGGVSGTLTGTAGVSNGQMNVGFSADADVEESVIEVGDFDGGIASEDMDGSTVSFTGNTLMAAITGNAADNDVSLSGVSQDGTADSGDQENSVDLSGPSGTVVTGDLFIANLQTNDSVTLDADIESGDVTSGLHVQTGYLFESSVIADDSTMAVSASGNEATNDIDVGSSSDFDSLVASSNLQYNTSTDISAHVDDALITVNVAEDDDVELSTITVDRASILASASGNTQSSALEIGGTDVDGVGAFTSPTIALDSAGATGAVEADFSVVNVQVQDSNSTVLAEIDANIDVDAAEGGTVALSDFTESSLSVSDATVSATASGNVSIDSSVSVDATAFDGKIGVLSVQAMEEGSSVTAELDDRDSTLEEVIDVSIDASNIDSATVEADGNALQTQAIGNLQSSGIELSGGVLSGSGLLASPVVDIDGTAETIDVNADFALVSSQLVDAGSIRAYANGTLQVFAVETAAVGTNLSNATISVTENNFSSLAVANLSSETSFSATDVTDFTGVVAIVNDQTVENDTQITSHFEAGVTQEIISVYSNAATISNVLIDVDANSISATAYANLADATTNSLTIGGVDIWDGGFADPDPLVDRSLNTAPDILVDVGFVLVNDQSVEDLDAATMYVTVQATEDLGAETNEGFIFLNVGSEEGDVVPSVVTFTDASIDDNVVAVSGTFNAATSAIGADAVTLDGSSALVNVQSVIDEDLNGASAGMQVSFGLDQFEPNIELNVNSDGGDATNNDFSVSGNLMDGNATINEAGNTINVTAVTQNVDSLGTGTINSTDLGEDSEALGEIVLLNDQYFESIAFAGVSVELDEGKVEIDIDADNGLTDYGVINSNIAVNDNSLDLDAMGNTAVNSITIDVGTVDMSSADTLGGALRGPYATLSSNQQSLDAGEAGISARIEDTDVGIDMDQVASIEMTTITVDGNSMTASAQANDVVNSITASGTSFVPDATSDSLVELISSAATDNDLTTTDTTFVVASRQVNEHDVSADIDSVNIELDADYEDGVIYDSSLSVSGNSMIAEARSNDSVNSADVDFTSNQAQVSVANYQESNDILVSAEVYGADIEAEAYYDDDNELDGSSIDVDNNVIAALASADRTVNSLTASGTNIYGATAEPPFNALNWDGETDAAEGIVSASADYIVANAQVTDMTGATGTNVEAIVDYTFIWVGVDEVYNASISLDDNAIVAQSVMHSAVNSLTLDASANLTEGGYSAPTAAINSLQVANDLSSSYAEIDEVFIGNEDYADLDPDIGTFGAAFSVSGNLISGSSTVNVATNSLDISGDANIDGNGLDGESIVVLPIFTGDSTYSLANYSVLNTQVSSADSVVEMGLDYYVEIGIYDYDDYLDINDDALSVDNNTIQGIALNNAAVNTAVLNAGANSDTTAHVANSQVVFGDVATVVAMEDIYIYAETEEAVSSAVSVSGNDILASATSNYAFNAVDTHAGSNLQEGSGATAISIGDLGVDDTDYAVLNSQVTGGTLTLAYIEGAGITQEIDDYDVSNDDVTSTVDGNTIIAEAISNDAVNLISLSAGNPSRPSAGIVSLQYNDGSAAIASISGAQIGTDAYGGSGSRHSVSGNTISATSIGNRGVNGITQ